jgi:septal ring factor EnvC (AmiA/AmiB activator)
MAMNGDNDIGYASRGLDRCLETIAAIRADTQAFRVAMGGQLDRSDAALARNGELLDRIDGQLDRSDAALDRSDAALDRIDAALDRIDGQLDRNSDLLEAILRRLPAEPDTRD